MGANMVKKYSVDNISEEIQQRFIDNESIKSFSQFLDDVQKAPDKFCRNSAEYVKDIFDYYGSYEVKDITGELVKRFSIFDNFHSVFGQERAQNQIYRYISSFSENRINKIILLHGPNGSAKTSLIASITAAMEDYSKKTEGAVYTFNWVFSDVGEKPGSIGFQDTNEKYNSETLAFVAPEDVTFRLSCSMKDNPLLLIPKKERIKFLKSLKLDKLPKHLVEAELCQKCHEIYNQLSINYGGDWSKIIRHIKVERFFFSKRFRKGLISIDPQINKDANSRPLNIEQSYRIPRILALSSMYEPFGDLVDANRGVVEFSEIFKRSVEANKYLLTTAEQGTISLPSFTAYLDCLIFATDNQTNLSIFKRDLDWPSFNGRFAYVRVPYVLKWSHEQRACEKIIENYLGDGYQAPHTSSIVSLWAILTRLRQSKNKLAKTLTYVEKAVLYDSNQPPDSWKTKDKQVLLKDLKEVATEYDEEQTRNLGRGLNDASYEGRSGASYREVENIIINCTTKRRYLSPATVFKAIEEMIKDENVYEFTRLYKGEKEEECDGIIFEKGYLDPSSILLDTKLHYFEQVWADLRKSAKLISEEEYLKLFEKYLGQIKSWSRKEKIQNQQTGSWETANEDLMSDIESKLGVSKSEAEDYRNAIFNKIASWAIKRQNADDIPYEDLFSDALEALRKNSDEEQSEQLSKLQQYILYCDTDDWNLVPNEDQDWVVLTIDNLKDLGYTTESIKEAIVFLINEAG